MKLYITGGPGSGKSFLTDKISKKHKVPKLELDDIVWDNNYKLRNVKKRNEELSNFLKNNNNWIIEGTYFDWILNIFEECDKIIFIQINVFIRDFRIIKRFFLNKFNKNSKKENFRNLFHMLLWNHYYERKIKKAFLEFTKDFKDKIIFMNKFNNFF